MNNASTKRKAEQIFARSTSLVIRFKLLVILAILACTVLSISQTRTLSIDTSNEGFFHQDDPILLTYNAFREQFGRDDMIAIAIKSDKIFTTEFLNKLGQLHKELEAEVPHVKEITSMLNARNTRGEGDVLLVGDLLTEFPDSEKREGIICYDLNAICWRMN